MDDDQDQLQETTTGTGRLLFMFLGMVVLCAVFFGLGYSLGKTSAPPITLAAEPTPAASGGAPKPSPLNADDSGSAAQPTSSGQLTFYDSVKKEPQPGVAAKSVAPAPTEAKPQSVAPAASEEARLAATVGMTPASPPPATGYTVQIAAVSRQGDADALVKALRKKEYPVFVAANAPDKLFHVQVGPFIDPKEADAMKARLMADGYKPIVKK
jgi:cell division septation protein DedD